VVAVYVALIITITITIAIMLDLGFSKLVRYEQNGQILFGDLQSHKDGEYMIKRLQGDLDQGFQPTGDDNTVRKVCTALSMRHCSRQGCCQYSNL
jgi:hypothetical protein